jgi:hypothetical protein
MLSLLSLNRSSLTLLKAINKGNPFVYCGVLVYNWDQSNLDQIMSCICL